MRSFFYALLFQALTFSLAVAQSDPIVISDSLRVVQLAENVYMHVSDQSLPEFGKFTSNGLVYINSNEAVLIDTPPSNALSIQLMNWVKTTFPGIVIKGVIVTHFHSDCLGGLEPFHKQRIKSYSHVLTPTLLKQKKKPYPIPKVTFDKNLMLGVGNEIVIGRYAGEGHTKDNIVAWIPEKEILFGGCLVKALKAGKGNIEDANLKVWSQTVRSVKQQFSAAKIVVPGHGAPGGIELLDYTIDMFLDQQQ